MFNGILFANFTVYYTQFYGHELEPQLSVLIILIQIFNKNQKVCKVTKNFFGSLEHLEYIM